MSTILIGLFNFSRNNEIDIKSNITDSIIPTVLIVIFAIIVDLINMLKKKKRE